MAYTLKQEGFTCCIAKTAQTAMAILVSQKIDLMIQTFFAVAREKTCCRVLRICVHPDNAPDIDFEKYSVIVEHLAKRPVI